MGHQQRIKRQRTTKAPVVFIRIRRLGEDTLEVWADLRSDTVRDLKDRYLYEHNERKVDKYGATILQCNPHVFTHLGRPMPDDLKLSCFNFRLQNTIFSTHDAPQAKELRFILGMPTEDHLLYASKIFNPVNLNHVQLILASMNKVYKQWDFPPVGGLRIRRYKSKYDEGRATLAGVVSSLGLSPSGLIGITNSLSLEYNCLAQINFWLPVTLTSTYSGGYQTGVILKTRCGLEINSCRLCIGEQLLRSPSGTLYVSSQIPQDSWCCDHPSSTPGCNSCGRQGAVEPLSNILGTLGREQRTARWAVVLVLQIMEVRHLPRDIAKSIIRLLPRPGTVASMIAHPVCTCAICLPIQDIDWEFARDIASGREGWKKWHARHPEVYMPIDYLHMCSDKVVCCNSWTSTNRLFGRA